MIKFVLSREFKLLTSNNFAFVFHKPKKIVTSYITILGRLNTKIHPRIGIIVAKKHVKQAHERNRIKRLIRESFRLNQHVLPNMDFIVIAKKNIDNFDNYIISKKLKELWYKYCYQFQKY